MTKKAEFYWAQTVRYIVICVVTVCVSMKWGGIVFAVTPTDSTSVQFHKSQTAIERGYSHNAEQLRLMLEGLAAHPDSLYRIKWVQVVGTASPEGSHAINMKYSEQRAISLYNYLKENSAIADSLTEIVVVGRDWRGLYSLVEADAAVPSKSEVLSIISPAVRAETVTEELSDSTLLKLRKLRTPYGYLYDNLFPRLRTSRLYVGYDPVTGAATASETDSATIAVADDSALLAPDADGGELTADTGADLLHCSSTVPDYLPYHRLALKTNLLYDAALFPNIEIEWRFNSRWSAALEGDFAWWGGWDRSEVQCFRIGVLSPEVKRWLRQTAQWEGFYIGAFAGCGYYDIEKHTRGFHGEGVMGGISVGYMWRLSRNLSLEAAAGGGYLYTRYKEYRPMDGHHVYQRTKEFNYVGPLKLKLSLVWRLCDDRQKKYREYNKKMGLYEK